MNYDKRLNSIEEAIKLLANEVYNITPLEQDSYIKEWVNDCLERPRPSLGMKVGDEFEIKILNEQVKCKVVDSNDEKLSIIIL